MINYYKYNAPYLSLLVIVFYWIQQLLTVKTDLVLPGSFSELAFRILITKCTHLGAIALLLYLEQENWHGMGFSLKNYKKQFMSGLLIGLAMFLLFNVGLSSILNNIFPKPEGSSSIFIYFKDPKNGDHFSVLVSDDNENIIYLHKWEDNNHPTMTNPGILLNALYN